MQDKSALGIRVKENDDHRKRIADLVAKAKRLDDLVNAEIEAISTEKFVSDRRVSLVPPLHEGEGEEVAPAKTSTIKVSSYGTETLTFRQAQRRLYNYCLASVKQHFPMLLDDVDVEAADHGTRALSNILEIVAPAHHACTRTSRHQVRDLLPDSALEHSVPVQFF